MRVFIYGDSWAARHRLDAGLSKTFPADVVSAGLSGCNTKKLVENLPPPSPVDWAVIVAGVNDMVQHRGPRAYARDMQRLISGCRAFADRVAVLSAPRILGRAPAKSRPGGQLVRFARRHLLDRGAHDVTEKYRAALTPGDFLLIDYDAFSATYTPGLYKDPHHLSEDAFEKLGEYMGACLATQAAVAA